MPGTSAWTRASSSGKRRRRSSDNWIGLASTAFSSRISRLPTPMTSNVCAVARAMKGSALVGSLWLTTSRMVK
ncbi:hypothetical protein G6F57_023751 [Rhizopus arrhizus]|nr:hypothetical protein G6F57_023751 [Rhizopus arrhizus]